MSSVLACFLGQFVCYTNQVFAEVFCAMYAGGVQTNFTEITNLKAVFNFICILSPTKSMPPNLTISLQVNFYQINFI